MMTLAIKLIVLAAITGNLLAFAWAIKKHFTRPEGLPPVMRVITLLGYLFGIGLLVVHAFAREWLLWRVVVGLMLCAVSSWLFLAALRANQAQPLSVAGSKDQPRHLNRAGPYARIRHPFYTSYLCTWVGAGIISAHAWMLIPAVVMGSLYWHIARAEERKFLSSPLADSYRAYRQQTGLFWPRVF